MRPSLASNGSDAAVKSEPWSVYSFLHAPSAVPRQRSSAQGQPRRWSTRCVLPVETATRRSVQLHRRSRLRQQGHLQR